jgi:hypothetical protein
VHVVDDPALRDRLFAAQGGTRGFGADADKVLVVTSDLSSVRWGWERHDCYVNGGIFVMNLCYALHYFGVAHCILHWSVSPETDREAHELLGVLKFLVDPVAASFVTGTVIPVDGGFSAYSGV